MQAPRSRLLASREYIAITSQTSHAFSCAFRLEYWLPKTEVLKTQSIFIFFNFSITDYGLACITGMTVRRFLELLKTHTVLSRGAIVVLVWGALVHQMTDYSAGYVIIGAYATPSLFKYFSVHCTPSCAHMHACRVRSYNCTLMQGKVLQSMHAGSLCNASDILHGHFDRDPFMHTVATA